MRAGHARRRLVFGRGLGFAAMREDGHCGPMRIPCGGSRKTHAAQSSRNAYLKSSWEALGCARWRV